MMHPNTLQDLQKNNPGIQILPVDHAEFSPFGRVHTDIRAKTAINYAREHFSPTDSVTYEPSVIELESGSTLADELAQNIYGGMPLELGWVHGRNTSLEGLEYHKSSEVIVAVTDLILLLGDFRDIQFHPKPSFDSSKVRAFYVPQDAVVELFPLVLHFAPLETHVQSGFCALIGLPGLTNYDLDYVRNNSGENVLLFGRNKWLMVHPDAKDLIRQGAYVGIRGENTRINPLTL